MGRFIKLNYIALFMGLKSSKYLRANRNNNKLHLCRLLLLSFFIILVNFLCYRIFSTACATDADCDAGSCCQKANLGKRSILDNGVCTAVSVFGEKCYIHGSCGCASGLSCIQDSLSLDL